MFTMETTRLIERCRQGDVDALGELYKAYAQRMRGVCRRYISDEQGVDDVLHDAFVIIFTSFDRLRDVSKAEPWMMSITRNVASKYKEQLDRLPFVPLEEAESLPAPDEERLRVDEIGSGMTNAKDVPLEDLMHMVERLPEGYRQVFRLSVFEGMSHKEIADMLGIEPHSSSSQLARAKKILRKMIRLYWAVPLLLLVPLMFFLFRKDKPIAKNEEVDDAYQSPDGDHYSSPKEPSAVQPRKPVIVYSPIHLTSFGTDTLKPVIVQAVDTIKPDTLSNLMAQEQNNSDTIINKELTDSTQTIPTIPQTLRHDIVDLIPDTPIKKQAKNNWQLALAYAGAPSSGMTLTDNYMTMPSYSDATARSTKLYNWGDYMDYVNANATKMDFVAASNMNQIAYYNSVHPLEPLTETKHHERPLTLQLSISRQLDNRWSLSSGISYTRLKSTFQGGNENTLIYRKQKLQYLGIPLQLNYHLTGGKRWSIYTSGGLQLDLPVSGRLSTQYIYGGLYAGLDTSPSLPTTISAPWMWSLGIGTGVQYEIVPHLNVYMEPHLYYFIPSSDAVETYRTEHPFDLLLPFGIRFTW